MATWIPASDGAWVGPSPIGVHPPLGMFDIAPMPIADIFLHTKPQDTIEACASGTGIIWGMNY